MANTESLFPILNEKRISPLARAAAKAELDFTGCRTEYRPLVTKSILSKVISNRNLPFTYAINPYRGCEFACRYCYARYAHEFLELKPEDFEHKIYFKENARWMLTQELKRLAPETDIALGTATDPYQPLERKRFVTRSILEAFASTSGLGLGIVTKSTLISRDIDLLKEIARRHRLTVHLTITTVDADLARILEPRAPRPDLRMKTVGRLRRAGLRAGVMCSPLMPGITDSRSSIGAVAKAAAAEDASFFFAGALFLKPCSQPTFFEFVGKHFPQQLEAYRRRYSDNAFVSKEYRERLQKLVEMIRRENKLRGRRESTPINSGDGSKPEPVMVQPWLPFS
ncbi:MAG TPA: radical SAM protein [Terracidiphilus sp.]|jgi:DNA repair photolyase|nr:radical SAM protein [Terracidiphilus sp.]